MIIPSDSHAVQTATMPERDAAPSLMLPTILAIIAALGGILVAVHYQRLGLTLSHYDARGHLIVARRIFDSITPGWQQIGAVWLPLPHVLNAVPVQVDAWYRSGASGVVLSIAAFAVTIGAIAWIVRDLSGSRAAALASAAVFGFNPNVLYLQATPMTEPLLLAFTTLGIAFLLVWYRSAASEDSRTGPREPASLKKERVVARLAGWSLACACLTRYEAWPVTACALTAALWASWRHGRAVGDILPRLASIAVPPALAVVGFAFFSRAVIGEWFVSSDFFVPENKALGHPLLSAAEIWYGLHRLSGTALVTIAAVGVGVMTVRAAVSPQRASALIAVALCATAAVPWSAFVNGHPFRIRYMVPLVAMEAVGAGMIVGLAGRFGLVAALLLAGVTAYELRPLDASAPMVVEAQWDKPNQPARARVTACLGTPRPGTKIMASMGSLGHYMQEASHAGFAVRDFLHEGNGDLWLAALTGGPRPYAEWVLIEEKAEGGDMLAKRAIENPHFLDGYARVCEGAGLALYRRQDAAPQVSRGQNLKLSVNR